MAKTNNVQVDIFDQAGRKLVSVYNGRLTKGDHRFDVANKINILPAGIYWFRISAAEESLPLKFVKQ
jgi:hypothetical protein